MERYHIIAEMVEDIAGTYESKLTHFAYDTKTGEKYSLPYDVEEMLENVGSPETIFYFIKEMVEEDLAFRKHEEAMAGKPVDAWAELIDDLPF